MSQILISPPVSSPVSVADMLLQLGMMGSPQDDANNFLAAQLQPKIDVATQDVESYCRRALVLQTWQWNLRRFPRNSREYTHHQAELIVPRPPLMAIDFVQYRDFTGTPVALPLAPSAPPTPGTYGYRLVPGGDQCAYLVPQFGMLWPPMLRDDAADVQVQFRAGYGGDIEIAVNGTQATGYAFAQGDVGNTVTIPGAVAATVQGAAALPLVTTIASVDPATGNATLATAATVVLPAVTAYYGRPVPARICEAIKFLAQFYYEQDVVSPTDWPPFVIRKLSMLRNLQT